MADGFHGHDFQFGRLRHNLVSGKVDDRGVRVLQQKVHAVEPMSHEQQLGTAQFTE
jgi:hypothetical protein